MPIVCTVYVWLASGGDIGHAAMQIGDRADASRYVSWWPADGADKKSALPGRKHPALVDTGGMTFHEDDQNEHGTAIRINLYSLDVGKMTARWRIMRQKPNAHYRLLRKNCSTMVARVLRAGGGAQYASVWRAHNIIWTPKDVLRFATQIQKNAPSS